GSIRSGPLECLHPGIPRNCPGPFNVSTLWKEIALCNEHSCTQRSEQRQPSPDVALQHMFADKYPCKNQLQHIKQIEASQRLNAGQDFEALRDCEHQSCDDAERAEHDRGSTH